MLTCSTIIRCLGADGPNAHDALLSNAADRRKRPPVAPTGGPLI